MGVFDTVLLEEAIELPAFPPAHSPSEIQWQTKDIGHPVMRTFKLTANGRLCRQETERREKTDAEKRATAREHGFESWADYVAFCKNEDLEALFARGIGPAAPSETAVAETYWLDYSMHGSFEFHGSDPDIHDGYLWSYEARFTRGDLDAIVFLGERGGSGPAAIDRDGPVIIRF